MKDNPNSPDNQKLDSILREWRCDAPLPPRFREQVWHRIERQQPAPSPSLWIFVSEWLNSAFPRPALATAYVAVVLVLGLTGGWVRAQHMNSHINDELQA